MRAVTTRELLRLALPSIAFAVLTNGYRAVDQFFTQYLSTESQAAVGSSIFVLILYFAGFLLVSGGSTPLVARAAGAGDAGGVRRVLGSALLGAVVLAVVLMVAGGLGAPYVADLLGLRGETNTECARYLATLSLTILPLVLTPVVDGAFVSLGSARLPLLLHGLSLALNVFLTWFLAVHLRYGVVGAALASNASRAVTTSIGLAALCRRTGLRWDDVRPRELRRIVRIGTPAALAVAFYSLVYWAVLETSVSPLGPHVNAALGIGFSALEGFTWPSYHGVSMAVGSFVGRALGAGEPERAWSVYRRAFPISTALGLVATAAFLFAGPFLTGLFAADELVHSTAAEYASLLALSQVAVAWESLATGVLEGAGDTRTVLWLSMPLNLLRVPLCWWLAVRVGLGPAGIWWGINVTSYLKTGAKVLAVHHGGWARLSI